jgi:hypothetical protein
MYRAGSLMALSLRAKVRFLFNCGLSLTAILTGPGAAHGQTRGARVNPPRACSSTQPATVASGGAVSGLSAAAGSNDTLYVLYDTRVGTRTTVSLLILSGVNGSQMEVNTVAVGEGTVGHASLVLLNNRVLGAYKKQDGRVAIFSHDLTPRGPVTEVLADAAAMARGVPSVAVVARRAVVAWPGRDGTHVHLLNVDANGQPSGTVQNIESTASRLHAAGVFGGAVAGITLAANATESAAGPVAWINRGRARAPAAMSAQEVRALSVVASARNALALSIAGGTARISLLRAAAGTGTERELGPAQGSGAGVLAATPWGAFALWASAGNLTIQAIGQTGTALGVGFPAGRFGGSAQEAFSAVTLGSSVYGFWGETGAVKMLRITCF